MVSFYIKVYQSISKWCGWRGWLRLGGVCRILGISYITLKRWIYSGTIRAVKTPTGRWRIPKGEVEGILVGEREPLTRAAIYARVSPATKEKTWKDRSKTS